MLANCIVARDILDNKDKKIKRFEEERCNLSSYVTGESTYQDTASILLETPFVAITYSLGSFLYMDTEQRFSLENMRKKVCFSFLILQADLSDQEGQETHKKDRICSPPIKVVLPEPGWQHENQQQYGAHSGKDQGKLCVPVRFKYQELQNRQQKDARNNSKHKVTGSLLPQHCR